MAVPDVVEAVDAGTAGDAAPDLRHLPRLFDFAHPRQALDSAAARDRSPILPEMQVDDDGGYLHLPHRLVALGESVAARRAGTTP